ncbi:hypothetical protein F8388_014474, partial [Cannabis sativa]
MERMFSLLYEAAHEGNVVTLRELLQQDRLILDRLIFINNNNNFSETPLHVAAMLDHVDFVKEIIIRKPELAKELDMWGSSPLHVASAKGHLKTIKVLLSNNIDHEVLCYAWDGEGRNPLHLAAMRGKIDVLRELLRVAPKAGQVNLAGRSENILHVCVKYNQFEVLKFLVNVMDDYHFLNAKDDYGMNILHLAVALKQIEIIKYLVTNTRIEVNDVNANKFTALDILAQSQRSEKDFDISECLRSVGASRTIDPPLPTHRPNQVINNIKVHQVNRKEKFQEDKVRKPENWLTRKRESLMVVASLIATMAFQAGTNPPGGLWQDDNSSTPVSNVTIADSPSNNHFAGESIMGYYKNKTFLYHSYLYSNTVGFVGSLSIILLLVTGLPFCRKFFMWILTVILWVTITAMTITYVIAICVVAPNNNMNIVVRVVLILIISWGGVMIVIALLHTIRLAIILFKWLLNVFMARRKKFILTNWDSSISSLLYRAAREGKVATLRELLQQDTLILDRPFLINNNSFSETPLHVAAMLGHVDFVKEIISHKPELAKELDMWHSTPLHLAVANDHLETVKLLLSIIDHELLCVAWDEEGRNPLHLAAMRGRLDVLRELLKVAPEAAQVNLKGRSSGTILHICVRHNQFEAMKLLVDVIDDYQFVNAKDNYGMTVLHLAVANKQIETVKYLLTNSKIEVNAVNSNMFTALDILAQSQRSEKDFDIVESLRSYGASRTIDQPLSIKRPIIQAAKASLKIPHDHVHQIRKNQEDNSKGTSNPEYYWLAKKRESLMIVASLIATMAFQAGISPPGGLWEDNGSENIPHSAGESIISYYGNIYPYHAYLVTNTIGFAGSLSIILLLVTGLPFCRKFLMWILTIILWVTVTAMTITYLIAIVVTAPRHDFHSTPFGGDADDADKAVTAVPSADVNPSEDVGGSDKNVKNVEKPKGDESRLKGGDFFDGLSQLEIDDDQVVLAGLEAVAKIHVPAPNPDVVGEKSDALHTDEETEDTVSDTPLLDKRKRAPALKSPFVDFGSADVGSTPMELMSSGSQSAGDDRDFKMVTYVKGLYALNDAFADPVSTEIEAKFDAWI